MWTSDKETAPQERESLRFVHRPGRGILPLGAPAPKTKEEVEKFRDETGMYPASEGYEAVAVDEAEIGRTCIRHNLSRICIPEAPWTGTTGVDFIDAEDFIRMLRESQAG